MSDDQQILSASTGHLLYHEKRRATQLYYAFRLERLHWGTRCHQDTGRFDRLEVVVSSFNKVTRAVRMTIYALAAGGWNAMLAKPAHGETLILNEVIRRALAYAPSVPSATAQSDLNVATVRDARAPLYPSLSAGSEYMQAPGYSAAVT